MLWLASAGFVLTLAGVTSLTLAVGRRTGHDFAGSLTLIAWVGIAALVGLVV
jgi:hypothetical protein